MSHRLALAIHGASGRNGRRLLALAGQDPSLRVAAALVGPESRSLGLDAGVLAGGSPTGLLLQAEWPEDIEVVIDFSSPEGCLNALQHCLEKKLPMVIATTGLTTDQVQRIEEAAQHIPICYAPNMSVAVNIAMKLVEQAARALKQFSGGVDVEIIERHHRMKEDSPSGTALKFGQLVAKEMGQTEHVHGRQGLVGKRPPNEIGYHAVRIGDDAGQHTICFGMMGELIEVRVAASNRDPYASGALAAAKYLVRRPAGLYSMFDVLGL